VLLFLDAVLPQPLPLCVAQPLFPCVMDFDPQLEFWLFASFPWWLGGGDIEKISLLGLALSCINEIDCSLLDTDDFLSSHLLLDSVSTIFENPFFIDVLWPVTSSLYDAFKSFLLVLSMLDLLIDDFSPGLSLLSVNDCNWEFSYSECWLGRGIEEVDVLLVGFPSHDLLLDTQSLSIPDSLFVNAKAWSCGELDQYSLDIFEFALFVDLLLLQESASQPTAGEESVSPQQLLDNLTILSADAFSYVFFPSPCILSCPKLVYCCDWGALWVIWDTSLCKPLLEIFPNFSIDVLLDELLDSFWASNESLISTTCWQSLLFKDNFRPWLPFVKDCDPQPELSISYILCFVLSLILVPLPTAGALLVLSTGFNSEFLSLIWFLLILLLST